MLVLCWAHTRYWGCDVVSPEKGHNPWPVVCSVCCNTLVRCMAHDLEIIEYMVLVLQRGVWSHIFLSIKQELFVVIPMQLFN